MSTDSSAAFTGDYGLASCPVSITTNPAGRQLPAGPAHSCPMVGEHLGNPHSPSEGPFSGTGTFQSGMGTPTHDSRQFCPQNMAQHRAGIEQSGYTAWGMEGRRAPLIINLSKTGHTAFQSCRGYPSQSVFCQGWTGCAKEQKIQGGFFHPWKCSRPNWTGFG